MDRIEVPLTEEQWFLEWCIELVQAGYIYKVLFDKEVMPLTLFERLNRTGTKKKILDSVTYKCDVLIYWNLKAAGIFYTPFSVDVKKTTHFWGHATDDGKYLSPVEVKAPPGYGNRNSSDQSFSVLQKWVYAKFGIMINKTYNYPISVIKYPKKHIVNKKKVNHPKANMFKRFKNPEPYLWMMTFTPDRYLYTDKTLVPKTISKWDPITLEQFLASKGE